MYLRHAKGIPIGTGNYIIPRPNFLSRESGLCTLESVTLKTEVDLHSMASRRLQGFQSVLRGKSHLLRPQQRRWAQVHDVRFLASHHDPKHVLEKYRNKLDEKAKQ